MTTSTSTQLSTTTTATTFTIVETSPTRPGARAVVLHSKEGPYTFEHDWPRPTITPGEVLIKQEAVGLNQIDWKSVSYGFGVHSTPWISGREGAGTIEEVGAEVKGLRRGQRVFVTSTNYRDNRTSTFQEYAVAAPHNVCPIPDWLTFEEAVTLGVGSVSAAAALFDALQLPRPDPSQDQNQEHDDAHTTPIHIPSGSDPAPWILIWGASCVTGTMAVQLAKQAGLRVAAVAGLHNADYLRDMGADVVLNRHDPAATVTAATALDIGLGIDCVGAETAGHAARALRRGGRLVCLVRRPDLPPAAEGERELEVHDVLIKRFHEDPAYGQALVDYLSWSLHARRVRPVRHEVVRGGLPAIEEGLRRLREGVSGKKLVVVVNEVEVEEEGG